MEKVVFEVPTLWADHHVLKVRDALTTMDGVEKVYASSAWKQVLVSYDADQVTPEVLENTLAEAGYPVGEGEVPIVIEPNDIRRDPKWGVLGLRMTRTNEADLEMSGEFRKY
jgi:copper chaperone CopZ